jgi:hypothetical protein
VRASDADTVPELVAGSYVFVSEGATTGQKGYVLADDAVQVGNTPLTFNPFAVQATRTNNYSPARIQSNVVAATTLNVDLAAPPAEIDTVDLSRRFFPEAKSHKLGELSQRLEVALIGAHRATNDAEACGRCFVALANRQGAPDDIAGLVEWADAIGEPPSIGGFLGRSADRTIVFTGGELDGKPVDQHPDHLAWMSIARARVNGAWQPAFPAEVRAWVERWLRVRGSGRAAGAMKGFGPSDWGIDPPLGAG